MDSSFLLLSSLFSLISNSHSSLTFMGIIFISFPDPKLLCKTNFSLSSHSLSSTTKSTLIAPSHAFDWHVYCFFLSPLPPPALKLSFFCDYWVRLHINMFSVTESTFHSSSLSGNTQKRILRSIALPSATGEEKMLFSLLVLWWGWCDAPFGRYHLATAEPPCQRPGNTLF